ncbi:MAG: hypothetical protein V5A77_05695 [Candidatus Bipolaricaulota bacterium]|nr:hypothetical protein [Candidatus Bipolaricaulota bacterium]
MSKLILDSDGLIKLQKAGLVKILAERHDCLIPEAVYPETVTKGKKELYEDAFEIEEIVEESIELKKDKKSDKDKQVLSSGDPTSLGKGEKQTLRIYFQEKGDAIISDDRTFLNLLDRNNQKSESEEVPFITPANAIVAMADKGVISNEEAKRGLEQIKYLIRGNSYQRALEKLERGGE